MVINVNGQSATRITGIVKKKTEKAALVDFESDIFWVPLSAVKINKIEKTIDIQDWKYKELFE